MTIGARFEKPNDVRGSARRTLRLGVVGRFGAEGPSNATVHNLSAAGLLIETSAKLTEGETFLVELPEAGVQEAVVIWADAPHYGCRFAIPISTAALAAAQLRADAAEAPTDESGEEFGDRLRRLRQERGLSLGTIAQRLGVSKPTVWAWEHGKSRPIDRRLSVLADVLGVTPGALQPGSSNSPEELEASRRQIANAYGVPASRVRIMIEL